MAVSHLIFNKIITNQRRTGNGDLPWNIHPPDGPDYIDLNMIDNRQSFNMDVTKTSLIIKIIIKSCIRYGAQVHNSIITKS